MDYELGIIGGMGTLATAVFFDYLARHTQAQRDQDHINALILNHASLADRTQVIKEGRGEDFLAQVGRDFDLLNQLDLKAIAIPCNTSHYFYDQMAAMSQAPIINMVERTLAHCKDLGEERVIVLATDGTAQAGLYQAYGQDLGLEVSLPRPQDQDKVMRTIYRVKEKGQTDQPDFLDLVEAYSQEGMVILACTELSVLDLGGRPHVDALKVLGREVIRACGREFLE